MTTGSLRVGVEHELRIWSGSTQLDFRELLPAVTGGLRALDPGDPRARRLPSGPVLTADGREAELVTPPVAWDASAPGKVDDMLATERTELATRVAHLAGADRLTGFSTHVNLTVPDDRVVDVCRRFALECGLATVLVAEPASSAGLLVRPRRGRLEIGGEYAEGEHLVALVTFVGAAVSALLAGAAPPHWPSAPTIVAAREKFGWFLPPEGPYADLLKRGRPPALTSSPDLEVGAALVHPRWRGSRTGGPSGGRRSPPSRGPADPSGRLRAPHRLSISGRRSHHWRPPLVR